MKTISSGLVQVLVTVTHRKCSSFYKM